MRIKIPKKTVFYDNFEITDENVLLNSIRVTNAETNGKMGFTILAGGTNHYKITMPKNETGYFIEYEYYYNTKSLSRLLEKKKGGK